MRREKEIAETRRELAEAENLQHKQVLGSTQRQLATAQSELKELCDNASSQQVTAAQHAEILKKVRTTVMAMHVELTCTHAFSNKLCAVNIHHPPPTYVYSRMFLPFPCMYMCCLRLSHTCISL